MRRVAGFRLAFVQGRPRFGDTAGNLERGLALAGTVDADLVVLPELWSSGYVFSSTAEIEALAEDAARGATARALIGAARRERRHYIAGFPERHRGRIYNSALLVGPRGVRAVYRKLHLFESERRWFTKGNLPLAVHRVGPARVGLMICFDWRFPEVPRVLALLGADVIAHPSNLVLAGAQKTLGVRSAENRVFLATANRTGVERRPGGVVGFTGRSQITDPSGRVMIHAGARDARACAVDCDLASARRKRLTSATDLWAARRPEFYAPIVRRATRSR
ncbi:MAG TPA: nitrilase-related carbon-nitrogen hydrolase [Candidatus Saccharimonadaceae bacterium]|nr:nitrilase-related carbon-nitrogen hydrolase [Candidatus Saccharimonadaceae bacterium]